MPPDKKKPAAGEAAGLLGIEAFRDGVDFNENKDNPSYFQARALQSRFAFSWPLAVVVAEHVFGGRAGA